MSPAPPPLEPDKLLGAFGITAEDLRANRVGALSPRQRSQIAASGTRNLLAAVAACGILALILLFVANRPLKPAQYIVSGLLGAAVLAVGVHDFRRTRAAGAGGRVECLTGPVHIISRGRQGWQLIVEGRTFRMPVHFWHIVNGAPYHVYFVEQANRIVAMEPVDGGHG